jgi:hypothetical protein
MIRVRRISVPLVYCRRTATARVEKDSSAEASVSRPTRSGESETRSHQRARGAAYATTAQGSIDRRLVLSLPA